MNRKKAWKTDMARSFFSVFFWIAVILFPVSDILTFLSDDLIEKDVVAILHGAEFGGFVFFSYVLFAIPYAHSYCQDLQNHFERYHVIQTGVKSYVKWKLIGCALSSGMAAMLGKIISFCIFASFYPLFSTRNGFLNYGDIVNDLVLEGRVGTIFVSMLLLIFLKALFFGCLAWMVSTWIPNIFFVYTIPIVLDKVVNNLFALFPGVYAFLSPSVVYDLELNGCTTVQGTLIYAVVFTLVWMVIFYRISYGNIKRRLENG